MATESPARHRVVAALAERAAKGDTTAKIGEAVLRCCQDLDSALTPIIGHRGVGALYERSLYLAARSHPWMIPTRKMEGLGIDTASLKTALGRQTAAEAAAGSGLLFQTFHELLVSLIGESLTERLLLSAWAPFDSGTTAKDDAA